MLPARLASVQLQNAEHNARMSFKDSLQGWLATWNAEAPASTHRHARKVAQACRYRMATSRSPRMHRSWFFGIHPCSRIFPAITAMEPHYQALPPRHTECPGTDLAYSSSILFELRGIVPTSAQAHSIRHVLSSAFATAASFPLTS